MPHEVTNTSAQERSIFDGLPGAIEASESRGQAELLASTTLPRQMGDRAAFEALGFTFGDTVRGDDLFIEATLPEGWQRKGSDHAMWSYVTDERGVERVAVFYKAAFYDRDAFMRLSNVGVDFASKVIWGEPTDPGYEEPDFSLLTPAELEQAREYAARDDYRDERAEKARALLARLG